MNDISQLLDDFFLSYTPSLSSTLRENRTERMKLLLKRIGNPERSFKTIHVAGSKGKGTVCTILSYLLSSLGYKTGLFLSPHVYSVKERFTLASVFFSDGEYLSTLESLKEKIDGFEFDEMYGDKRPTTFELYTAYSYLLFKETGCTWAVIETGLGGRLDATNTLDSEAVVITEIEKEHTKILGDTLSLIAKEKSGIMRKKKPTFIIKQEREVMDVFEKKSKELNSPLFSFIPPEIEQDNNYRVRHIEYMGATLILKSFSDDIFLFDALYCLFIISSMGLTKQNVSFNLTSPSFHLPGRFEVRKVEKRTFIFDGAHTVHSIELLSKSIERIEKKKVLIFSTALDKNWRAMAALIVPLHECVILTGIGKWKKSSPELIYLDIKDMFPYKDIFLILDRRDVVSKALSLTQYGDEVTITGSFYLLSEIDSALKEI